MNLRPWAGRWRLIVRTMGLPGFVALAMLLMWAGLIFVVEPLQERELDKLQSEVETVRGEVLRRARQQSVKQTVSHPSGSAQWRQDLPAVAERQPRVAELLGRAAAHGLVAKRSEYRYASEAGAGVARYRISLPVIGSYDGLRDFLEDVLAADPALMLDGIRLRRAQAQATQVQAELQFSLLMREAGGSVAAAATVPVQP